MDYVVGLVFEFAPRLSGDSCEVLLIRKMHPEWQRGMLNGLIWRPLAAGVI